MIILFYVLSNNESELIEQAPENEVKNSTVYFSRNNFILKQIVHGSCWQLRKLFQLLMELPNDNIHQI